MTSAQLALLLAKMDAIIAASVVMPTGSIISYGGATNPSGYLPCDGAAVSRTTYANLFTAIGVVWGTGNGTTTFNVPDLRGRAQIGVGTGSGLTARALGDDVGEETHQLVDTENGTHSHTVSDLGHTHGAAAGQFVVSTGAAQYTEAAATGGGIQASTASATTGITLSDSPAMSSPHNNMQPSAAVNMYIKT